MSSKPNIYQRLNAVMNEVKYIQKGDKAVNNQYRFASHDQVTAALHDSVVKHGIFPASTVVEFSQEGNRTFVMMEVSFINIDDPTDRHIARFPGYGIDTQDKGIGKAISYAFKYALLKEFMLETGDDPERDNIDFTPITEKEIEKKIADLSKKLSMDENALMGEYMDFCKDFFKKKHKDKWMETLHGNLVKILEDVPKFVQDMNKWNEKRQAIKE